MIFLFCSLVGMMIYSLIFLLLTYDILMNFWVDGIYFINLKVNYCKAPISYFCYYFYKSLLFELISDSFNHITIDTNLHLSLIFLLNIFSLMNPHH